MQRGAPFKARHFVSGIATGAVFSFNARL